MVQLTMGLEIAPMYDESLSDFDYLIANFVIIAAIFIFELVYRFARRSFTFERDQSESNSMSAGGILTAYPVCIWLAVVVVSVLLFLSYENFNLTNIILRGGSEDVDRQETSKLMGLIFGKFLRYVPISAALFYSLCQNKSRYLSIFLWASGIFCCFPTGVARLQVLPVYLPIIMLFFKSIRTKKKVLVSVLMGGVLFVFPFLHGFRNRDLDLSNFHFFDFSFLNSLNFDSFASLALVIKNNVCTGGQQLVGALLFWFPRDWWPDKPIESGRMIAERFELGIENDFTNISMNWFAEGYLNFGWFGVFIWCVVLASACGVLDAWFWNDERNFCRKAVVYYFSGVGFLIFMLRGDMMNGVAFTTGLLASHAMMGKIMLRKESDA